MLIELKQMWILHTSYFVFRDYQNIPIEFIFKSNEFDSFEILI